MTYSNQLLDTIIIVPCVVEKCSGAFICLKGSGTSGVLRHYLFPMYIDESIFLACPIDFVFTFSVCSQRAELKNSDPKLIVAVLMYMSDKCIS